MTVSLFLLPWLGFAGAVDEALWLVPEEQVAPLFSGGPGWASIPRSQVDEMLSQLREHERGKAKDGASGPDSPDDAWRLSLQRGHYEVEVGDRGARVEGRVEVVASGRNVGWVLLDPGGAAVESIRLDEEDAPATVLSDGTLAVFVVGEGAHQLLFRWSVPVMRMGAATAVQFAVPHTPITRVVAVLPPGVEGAEAVPALASRSRRLPRQGGRTVLEGDLRYTGSVFVRWIRDLRDEEPGEPSEGEEEAGSREAKSTRAQVNAVVSTRYTLEGARLDGSTEVVCSARGGKVAGVSVALPEGTEVLDVSGPSIAGHRVLEGGRRLDVAFSRLMSGSFRIGVDHVHRVARAGPGYGRTSFELPLLAPVGEVRSDDVVREGEDLAVERWRAGPPGTGQVNHTETELVVRTSDGASLSWKGARGLRRALPSELSPRLRDGGGTALAARSEEGNAGNAGLELRVERPERLETPVHKVTRARLTLVEGHLGVDLSRLHVQVRNNQKQHMVLLLPPGSVAVDCKVRGEPQKPGRDAEGHLIVPLVRSVRDATGLDPFPVEVAYMTPRQRRSSWINTSSWPLPRIEGFPIDRLEVEVLSSKRTTLVRASGGLSGEAGFYPEEQILPVLNGLFKLVKSPLRLARSLRMPHFQDQLLSRTVSDEELPMEGLAPREPLRESRGGSRSQRAGRADGPRRGRRAPDAKKRKAALLRAGLAEVRQKAALESHQMDESLSELAEKSMEPADVLGEDAAGFGDGLGDFEGDGLTDQAMPVPASAPAPAGAGGGGTGGGEGLAGAYLAMQQSLGEQGALPVGVTYSRTGRDAHRFTGAHFGPDESPGRLSVLALAPPVRTAVELGLALVAFYLMLWTLRWAMSSTLRWPCYGQLVVLPLLAISGDAMTGWNLTSHVLGGLALGVAAALLSSLRARLTR